MKRALAVAALVAGCNNTVPIITSGQFASPVGLGATSAGDRDLIFIANSGRDGLIALQLCNIALLPDGGTDPSDKCSSNENAQFIPGPIRVFPATIETAPRTVRVAGARLTLPDGGIPQGGAGGEALAVGADESLDVVDARSLVDAEHGGPPPKIISGADAVQLGGVGLDVVAANAIDPVTSIEVPSPSVRVFAATESPAQLLVLTATLDANGTAQSPTIDARCTLDPVVPRKLALVPGRSDIVYVADGAGDGVVSIQTDSIAGGPCTMTRISAGGRPTRSVALNPPWHSTPLIDPVDHPAGEIVMMVVEPLLNGGTPGRAQDAGGVLFARTTDGALFPPPPYDWRETGHEAMQPLQPSGLAREATFLRSFGTDDGVCLLAGRDDLFHCTPLNLGSSGIDVFDLLAVVTGSDGATTFIDVPGRRFPDPSLEVLTTTPTLLTPLASAISPSIQGASANVVLITPSSDPNQPTLTVDPNSAVAGVTRSAIWRAIYHSPMVGLDRRAGSLLPGPGAGTMAFVTPPVDLSLWEQDPAIQLAPGDLVALGFWSTGDPNCQGLVATQNDKQFTYEMPIVSISGNTVVLDVVDGTPDLSGSCGSVNAVAEFRTGGDKPWLILAGPAAVGRATTGVTFSARETRFDYPFLSCDAYLAPSLGACPDTQSCDTGQACIAAACYKQCSAAADCSVAGQTCLDGTCHAPVVPPCYDPENPPLAANDTSFQFIITGSAPLPLTGFTWQMGNEQGPVSYGDPLNLSGFASGVMGYASPRVPSLIFTSLTGSNELIQADPAILRSDVNGVQGYR